MKERRRNKNGGREEPPFGRVLSSGQRTMQSWHSRCLVPEGIVCHMVPLMSRASPAGDVGHNTCTHVCVCLLLCTRVHEHPHGLYLKV